MRTMQATFVRGVVRLDDLPKARIPEIAFSGRSNVGKSSLLNRLVGIRGLAKVSRTPGKTRELNFFEIGGRFHLVDLPGYGYARVPEAQRRKWSPLVEGYLESREQLAGVVQLVDLRHGPTDLDEAMIDWLHDRRRAILVVGTKQDKLARGAARQAVQALEERFAPRGIAVIGVSVETGAGMTEILAWIEAQRKAWHARSR
jgi:GTP-binding protein